MSIRLLIYVSLFFCFSAGAFATNPLPKEIYHNVKAKWSSKDVNGLGVYLQAIYAQDSKYVPAIVCSAFYQAVYLGKISSARSTIQSILTDAMQNPEKYTDESIAALRQIDRMLDSEIAMHNRRGTTVTELESSASAQTVRDAWGDFDFPFVEIFSKLGAQRLD